MCFYTEACGTSGPHHFCFSQWKDSELPEAMRRYRAGARECVFKRRAQRVATGSAPPVGQRQGAQEGSRGTTKKKCKLICLTKATHDRGNSTCVCVCGSDFLHVAVVICRVGRESEAAEREEQPVWSSCPSACVLSLEKSHERATHTHRHLLTFPPLCEPQRVQSVPNK